MLMRVVVPVITALVMIVMGAFELLVMLPGMNVYGDSTWTTILIANSVLVLIIIFVASVVSGLLAHVIQKRSAVSPWVVGPLTILAVTAVAIVTMFTGVSILTTIIAAARHSPAPPTRQPTPVNRRGGGDKRIASYARRVSTMERIEINPRGRCGG